MSSPDPRALGRLRPPDNRSKKYSWRTIPSVEGESETALYDLGDSSSRWDPSHALASAFRSGGMARVHRPSQTIGRAMENRNGDLRVELQHYAAVKRIICKIISTSHGFLSWKERRTSYIYENLSQKSRGSLVKLSTRERAHALFFRFFLAARRRRYPRPSPRFHLYSVRGQTFYEISARLHPEGVDGIGSL